MGSTKMVRKLGCTIYHIACACFWSPSAAGRGMGAWRGRSALLFGIICSYVGFPVIGMQVEPEIEIRVTFPRADGGDDSLVIFGTVTGNLDKLVRAAGLRIVPYFAMTIGMWVFGAAKLLGSRSRALSSGERSNWL